MRALLIHLLLTLLCTTAVDARTWHVQPDGGGDAPTIQAAVDSAQAGDDVLLAPGVYTWTSQAPTGTSMIRMKPGVWLHSQAGPGTTILDAELNGRLILCENVGEVHIEGLTLLQGSVQDISPGGGGLLATGDSTPSIVDCVFRSNSGIFGPPNGGAIYCDVATIRNSEFHSNSVGNGSGGAIFCGAAIIEGCVFRANGTGGDTGSGGAIATSSAAISDCLFEGNQVNTLVTAFGGAIAAGGITSITSCIFIGNSARSVAESGQGGAVSMVQGTVTSSVFLGNTVHGPSGNAGGAIRVSLGGQIQNCTILGSSGAHANDIGGIAMDGPGTIEATILANTVQGQACSVNPDVTWSCNDLFGNALGDAICGTDGGGNFSADPQFCAADPQSSVNVSLQEDSPCAPGEHPDAAPCGLIGAGPVSCGSIAVQQRTWGDVKQLYR